MNTHHTNMFSMRLLTVILACFLSGFAYAQKDSMDAPFRKFPGIPPIDLLKTDSSSHITKANINAKHKTLLMFFSPECSHCQHQTEDMLAAIDSLKEIQIIMATYQPFEEMVAFSQKYGIDKYSNIKLGRDIKYFLPPFFRMKSLPYLALYDNSGNFITSYEGNVKVSKLLETFDSKH